MSGDIDVASAIGAGEITSDKIANAAVTSEKIATGAVGSTQLASTGVSAATYGSTTQVPVIIIDEDGRITSASNQGIVVGSAQLSSTGVVAATYGGASAVPVLVVDEDGRITSAANVTVSIGANVTIADNTTSSGTFYPTMTTALTGNVSNVTVSSTKLYFVPQTGTLSATEFNSLSDLSVKENIITISSPLSVIEKLTGVEFNWIHSKKKSSGVVAQDVEKVLSHLVSNSETGMKTVNYDGIIAYLIESVKELSDKVKKLENK